MENLDFTEDEKKYIKETFDIVLDDLREIYKLTSQPTICVEIQLKGSKKYLLCLSETKIALLTLNSSVLAYEWEKLWIEDKANLIYNGNLLLETRYKKVGKRRKKDTIEYSVSRKKINDLDDLEIITKFIFQYDEIRAKTIKAIELQHGAKNDFFSELAKIRTKYGGEVIVDLGVGKTQNMQKIELEEENGKKIGTIDFGDRLVKIITEGDIVLTKIERTKEKIKK